MDEESIFQRAIEIDSRAAQIAFLDEACGNDRHVRASVESLLKHHEQASRFLELPPAELQQTATNGHRDTLMDDSRDATLRFLRPSANPGCIGSLGPYQVLDIVGRGGMGVVVRARDPKLNRIVAIKLMNEALAVSPLGRKRFLREAQVAAGVKHINVVTIHGIHEDDGPTPYLVMEFIEGVSLQSKIESHELLTAETVVRIGGQIAGGLEAAHRCGVVHRDIKPANILLEAGSERVKITDFGLARATDDLLLTRDGELIGTPQYMSPEQARGEKADPRSDLFSLGSVLYTLCTGHAAFSAETAIATLRGICDDHPRPIREINDRIPRWLERIVHRLLEKDPDQRPQTAAEVMKLLDAGPVSRWPATVLRPAKVGRKQRTIALAVGTTSIILVGMVLILMRNGRPTRAEVPDGSQNRIVQDGTVEVENLDQPPSDEALFRATPSMVQDVVAEMVKLNPGFDGQVTPTVVNNEVVELHFCADEVTDISPLESFSMLQSLTCRGSTLGAGQLADLSPLEGMQLEMLNVERTRVADLAPLRGMPLRRLHCADAPIVDLAPLAGMPLTHLYIQYSQVADLEPLRDSPLQHLNIAGTPVSDLSPLYEKKLITFYCDESRVADLSPLANMPLRFLNWRKLDQTSPRNRNVVRAIATLELIDGYPPDEFWQRLDGKQNDK